MTIKFHRPVYDENIKEGDIRTLDETQEYYYVSHNFANYCPDAEYVQAIEESTAPKVKTKKVNK